MIIITRAIINFLYHPSNLDEMLNYDNALKHKIREIRIYGRNIDENTRVYMYLCSKDSAINNFSETVTVKYELSKSKEETVLKNDLKLFFDKTKVPFSFIYKFTLYHLLLVLSVSYIGYRIYEFGVNLFLSGGNYARNNSKA